MFSQYSIPKELITDNKPEFTSSHFKKFSKNWDFKHQTVSQSVSSNGFVEESIQNNKCTLKKAKWDQ